MSTIFTKFVMRFKKSLPEIVKTLHELSSALKSAEKIIFDVTIVNDFSVVC